MFLLDLLFNSSKESATRKMLSQCRNKWSATRKIFTKCRNKESVARKMLNQWHHKSQRRKYQGSYRKSSRSQARPSRTNLKVSYFLAKRESFYQRTRRSLDRQSKRQKKEFKMKIATKRISFRSRFLIPVG